MVEVAGQGDRLIGTRLMVRAYLDLLGDSPVQAHLSARVEFRPQGVANQGVDEHVAIEPVGRLHHLRGERLVDRVQRRLVAESRDGSDVAEFEAGVEHGRHRQ